MNDLKWLGEARTIGDRNQDAIGGHRRIQRDHGIGRIRAQQITVAALQRLAQCLCSDTYLGGIRQFRRKDAIHKHKLGRALDGNRCQRGARSLDRIRVRRRRERQDLAHQRAQVGIFPFLDPAVREPCAFEVFKSLAARFGDLARTRQALARDRKHAGYSAFRLGLCQSNVHT